MRMCRSGIRAANTVYLLAFGAAILVGLAAGGVRAADTPSVDKMISELNAHYYDLRAAGASDLVCVVTSPYVDQMVRDAVKDGNAQVQIKLLWKLPNKFRFLLRGLPQGQTELQKKLLQTVSSWGPYVVHTTLVDLLRQSKAEITTEGGLYKITGTIEDPQADISRYEAYVKPDSWEIDHIVTHPRQGGTVTLTYTTDEWGGKRHITQQKSRFEQEDGKVLETNISYTYGPGDGVWAVQRAVIRGKNADGEDVELLLLFSNYLVNLGLTDDMFKAAETETPTAG
jgi:hypothetical protein